MWGGSSHVPAQRNRKLTPLVSVPTRSPTEQIAMRRLKDYSRFLVWNSGLGYIALWTITFWTLDYGQTVLGAWGGCSPAPNTALFYWVCDSASPFSILAAV